MKHVGTNEFSPLHSHEPTIPRTLDPEGRCWVCGLLVRIEELEAGLKEIAGMTGGWRNPRELRNVARATLGSFTNA